MVVKFLSKYILEVIPSIVATVIGAYIVTHYINTKTDADKPKAEVASPVDSARGVKANEAAKPAETTAPKAARAESEPVPTPAAKQTEKPSETASAPAEPRRRQTVARERSAAKTPVAAPIAETGVKETGLKAEETRDANEIAREAIERLRNSEPPQAVAPSHVLEAVGMPEAPRPSERPRVIVTYAPAAPAPTAIQAPAIVQPPAVQAAQPTTSVAPPLSEVTVAPAPQPPIARVENSSRPMPPADIPSRPLDLRANSRTSVAEDIASTAKDVMLSAKSVIQAVVPGTN
jgi:hypothetical protein